MTSRSGTRALQCTLTIALLTVTGVAVLPRSASGFTGGVGRRFVAIAEIDPLSAVVGSVEVRSVPSLEAEKGKIEIRDVTSGTPVVLGAGKTGKDGDYKIAVSALTPGQIIQAFNIDKKYASSGVQVSSLPLAPQIEEPVVAGSTMVDGHATPGAMVAIVNAVTGAILGQTSSPLPLPGDGSFYVSVPSLPLFSVIKAFDIGNGLAGKHVPVLAVTKTANLPPSTCPMKAGAQGVAGLSAVVYSCGLQQPRGIVVAPGGGDVFIIAGAAPADIVTSVPLGVFRLNPSSGALSQFSPVHGVGLQFGIGPIFPPDLFLARPRIYMVRKGISVNRGDGEIFRLDQFSGEGQVFTRLFDFTPSGIAFDATTDHLFNDDMVVSGYLSDRLVRINAAGNVSDLTVGLKGAVGLAFDPSSLAAFGEDLFVAQPAGGAVHRVNAAGVATPFVQGLVSPVGLAFGPGGPFGTNLYVADAGAGTISVYDPSGTPVASYGGFSAPIGLAFDASIPALYISEYSTGRVIKVQ